MISAFYGAVGQQAITWTNIDPDLCRHMASLGHNELTHVVKDLSLAHGQPYDCHIAREATLTNMG